MKSPGRLVPNAAFQTWPVSSLNCKVTAFIGNCSTTSSVENPRFSPSTNQSVKVRQIRSQNSLHDPPTAAFVNGVSVPVAEHGQFATFEARRFTALDARDGNGWTTLFW